MIHTIITEMGTPFFILSLLNAVRVSHLHRISVQTPGILGAQWLRGW